MGQFCSCSEKTEEINIEQNQMQQYNQKQKSSLEDQQQFDSNTQNIQKINKKFKQLPEEVRNVNMKNIKVVSSKLLNNSGQLVIDNYQIGKLIGEGTNSEIFKVKHRISQELRAMKRVDRNYVTNKNQEKGIVQVQNLTDTDHPNIMKVFEYYQDFKFDYIISDYYEGGDLLQILLYMEKFSEQEAGQIMFQLLSSVNYLHQQGIMHRDIKPEKICFSKPQSIDQLKLIGFGESVKYTEEINQDEIVGTPFYIAPEVLKGSYNEKCDLWSCGVVLAIMLTGEQLFNGETTEDILEQIKEGYFDLNSQKWYYISDEAKDFIKSLLSLDYNKRPSAQQALNNPWLQKMKSQNVVKVNLPNLKSQLNSLQQFKRGKALSHAVKQFIVDNLVTAEEKQLLQESFQALDTNGDGFLSKQEVLEGYKKIDMENQITSEMVDNIFKNIDNNQNGQIDFQEFQMAAINQKKMFSAQSLKTAFKLFDDENKGYITIKQLQQMFTTQQNQDKNDLTQNIWQELIQEFDENSDGQISLDEFIKCIQNKFNNKEVQKSPNNKPKEQQEENGYNIVIHENN